MALPDIDLGDTLDNTCKHVKKNILFAIPKDSGDKLATDKDNTALDKRLAIAEPDAVDYGVQLLAGGVQRCTPDPTYDIIKNRLLRISVKDAASISPICYALALQNYRFSAPSGSLIAAFAWAPYELYYRGQSFYPSYYDPTDPLKGGSGHTNYTTWALKRGAGALHGACSNGIGEHGTIDYVGADSGKVLMTGEIVGGVIMGFPPSETYLDSTLSAVGAPGLTGLCLTTITEFQMSINYYFCTYPEGDAPSQNPGP